MKVVEWSRTWSYRVNSPLGEGKGGVSTGIGSDTWAIYSRGDGGDTSLLEGSPSASPDGGSDGLEVLGGGLVGPVRLDGLLDLAERSYSRTSGKKKAYGGTDESSVEQSKRATHRYGGNQGRRKKPW